MLSLAEKTFAQPHSMRIVAKLRFCSLVKIVQGDRIKIKWLYTHQMLTLNDEAQQYHPNIRLAIRSRFKAYMACMTMQGVFTACEILCASTTLAAVASQQMQMCCNIALLPGELIHGTSGCLSCSHLCLYSLVLHPNQCSGVANASPLTWLATMLSTVLLVYKCCEQPQRLLPRISSLHSQCSMLSGFGCHPELTRGVAGALSSDWTELSAAVEAPMLCLG